MFVSSFILYKDVKKYIPGYPGYSKALLKVGLIFRHHSPLSDGAITFGLGNIALGGTLCTPFNYTELGAELSEFMDNAKNGMIYLSFGSYVNSFSADELAILKEKLSRLPYKVDLKADPAPPNLPRNVKVLAWLPQQSLLQHPNVKLFITHGGYASKIEGLCAGVPLFVFQDLFLIRNKL